MKLHIGGTEPKPGWRILNINPAPHVDYVGNCMSMPWFADNSIDDVYASHVMEHLGHRRELDRGLREVWRILKPGGRFCISVPDFDILCRMFIEPELTREDRMTVMRHVFGDQEDDYDLHKVGLTFEFLLDYLARAGFSAAQRVKSFGLFDDYSTFTRFGVPISLNVEAFK